MKKISKRVIMLALAMAMLCTLTVAAFAATYTGSFTITFGNGNYVETLTVSNTSTSASLSITNYNGFYEPSAAASIEGTVWATLGNRELSIGGFDVTGGLSCSGSCNYYNSDYDNIHAICEYKFMGISLHTRTVYES